MVGRNLAHYQIVAAIGAGGMGEVFRATDGKLGRDVALKILPAETAKDPERLARFQREARAVAALNHPHIVTIFSVEECDGIHFLTMELVDGSSLEKLIPKGGMDLARIVEIAASLADALDAAHQKSIAHRDLKPANVMVTSDGRVKVLDFGLAKDVRADKSSDRTATSFGNTASGVMLGTPAYMSPEQIAARTIDHRTDIFSLGVMLHEMATGKQPFQGESSAELITAILRDTPPPVTELRPELPADLARIVRRCLEKDPKNRWQTARDVGNELRDLARQGLPAPAPRVASLVPSGNEPAASGATSGEKRADEGFWVAVLPFKCAGQNADLALLADGLSEGVVTGMSRFSYLRVVTRGATLRLSDQVTDVREAGKLLGARYVMDGTLRLSGSKLRVTAQMVDATSGAHLWSETYERSYDPAALFDLQDDLVPCMVSTVADRFGVLPRSMSKLVRSKSAEELTPYEAVLRSFSYAERATAPEHAAAREALELAVQRAPYEADCWATLANVYRDEYMLGFNTRPDPLGRSMAAARKAVELDTTNHRAHVVLAGAHYFQKNRPACLEAAERAIALNPMDGSSMAHLGSMIAFGGDWERGLAMAERARQLNPHHPGWYWLPALFNAYRTGDYAAVPALAIRVNMPDYWLRQATVVAAYGQLGDKAAADRALAELLALRPDSAVIARQQMDGMLNGSITEQLLDGLRKAGLEGLDLPPADAAPNFPSGATPSTLSRSASAETRTDDGFWVAVLPFKYSGANADISALADGLSEEILTGLSRFSYLRVIARGATVRFASEAVDVRDAARQLGARYLMEGTLRQAGSKLRVAVQLVDAVTGTHLWAETYERAFQNDSIFDLQDELVPRIVSTVADQSGVLTHSMSERLRRRAGSRFTPLEAVLRAFGYFERFNAEEHAEVRSLLEAAVAEAPGQSDAWAILGSLYHQEYVFGFNPRPDPLGRARAAAQRAIEAGPSNHLAYYELAGALFFQKDMRGFRQAAEQAMALNPMDGSVLALMGTFLAYSGEWERGCAIVERAAQLNPHHPGWYCGASFLNAYRLGQYGKALDIATRMNMPGYWMYHMFLAAAHGQNGELAAARADVQALLAAMPDFASQGRAELAKSYQPEMVELICAGLHKAGLKLDDPEPPPASAATLPYTSNT